VTQPQYEPGQYDPGQGAQSGPPQPGYGYGTQPGYGAQPPPGPPGYGPQGQHQYPGPAAYGWQQPYPAGGNQYGSGADPSLAEWWRRLLARVIDGLVIGLVSLVGVIPVSAAYTDSMNAAAAAGEPPPSRLGSFFLTFLIICGLAFFYDWLQHAAWGQTLGKRALGTMVVTADTRTKISGGAAASRAAVYALPPIVLYIGSLFTALNDLWLLWDPRHQCLHDKAAHTVVIKTSGPAGTGYQPQPPSYNAAPGNPPYGGGYPGSGYPGQPS
jgi:uncharacterized RDD family membrane protein YckC